MDYAIKPQTMSVQGVQIEVPIKRITRRPGEGKEGMTFFPINFPLLKVCVSAPEMGTEVLEVTWSNFYSESDPVNPGKWAFRLIDQIPEMIYDKDSHSQRAVFDKNGKKIEDRIAMAKKWGSHWEPIIGWTYGENHPMKRTVLNEVETSSINGIEAILAEKFGNDLMSEILNLFVTHELFTEFLRQPTPQEEMDRYRRMRIAA